MYLVVCEANRALKLKSRENPSNAGKFIEM